ncbi:AraC family transcriptional regulator [soil metagenome]
MSRYHAGALDLVPLYNQCIFRSDLPSQVHDVTTRELAVHDLRWKNGVVDTVMHKLSVRDMHLYSLQYGAEVEVRPVAFTEQVMVHTAMQGPVEIDCDGERLIIPEGRSGWIAPRRSVRLRWSSGSKHLLLKIPRRMMQGGTQSTALLAPVHLLPASSEDTWMSLMQGFMHASSIADESPARQAWARHYESTIAAFLCSHERAFDADRQPSSARDDPAGGALPDARSGLDRHRLDAMLRYMHDHLSLPISLNDLAAAAGLSARALQALCSRQLKMSPMDMLRTLRLDAVNRQLRSDPDSSVTRAALEHGFSHLGRFSASYRNRFGELPSQTQSGAV